jgi:hypothetical protein
MSRGAGGSRAWATISGGTRTIASPAVNRSPASHLTGAGSPGKAMARAGGRIEVARDDVTSATMAGGDPLRRARAVWSRCRAAVGYCGRGPVFAEIPISFRSGQVAPCRLAGRRFPRCGIEDVVVTIRTLDRLDDTGQRVRPVTIARPRTVTTGARQERGSRSVSAGGGVVVRSRRCVCGRARRRALVSASVRSSRMLHPRRIAGGPGYRVWRITWRCLWRWDAGGNAAQGSRSWLRRWDSMECGRRHDS